MSLRSKEYNRSEHERQTVTDGPLLSLLTVSLNFTLSFTFDTFVLYVVVNYFIVVLEVVKGLSKPSLIFPPSISGTKLSKGVFF